MRGGQRARPCSPSSRRRKEPSKAPAAKSKPAAKPKAKAAEKSGGTSKTPTQPAAAPAAQPAALVQPLAEEASMSPATMRRLRRCAISPSPATKPARLREALAAAAGSRVQDAKASRDKLADPAARKLVDWYLHRGGFGTAAEIRAFLDANPAWPDRSLLTQRAEEALFNGTASPRDIKAFFASSEPRTAIGFAMLASAHLADKDEATAKALARKAWVDLDMPAGIEPGFLKLRRRPARPRPTTSAASTACCSTTRRWAGERNERAAVIRRTIALLSEEEKKKAEARLAVFLRAKNSQKLMSKLPAQSQADWGLAVQKAQALRRQKKEEEAWKILLAEPEAQAGVKPDGWWEERRASAYAALQARQAQDGLRPRAQSRARCPSMPARTRRSWRAGWRCATSRTPSWRSPISRRLAKAADGPLSHARGQYWLGRT